MRVTCCIAGGGPAGIMLGYLLARCGVDVAVLEKHADFLRDFRGDTVHPSTLDVMAELGLLDDFLKIPHEELRRLGGLAGNTMIPLADFSHVPARCKFIAILPQWDFLNFLAGRARGYPNFRLLMQTEVTDVIESGGRIAGVRATSPDGPLEIAADLVVGADGRGSVVRSRAGLIVEDLGAPMDVLWMRLSKRADEAYVALGRVLPGRILVTIPRGDHWQCGYVIPKGGIDDIRARGLPALREDLATIAPFLSDRVDELRDWSDVKLLTVRVDRLRTWSRPGLLCIGDAAHAMSPIGGVGINLAIQDAVATANILGAPLLAGRAGQAQLARVQRRRAFPTKATQALQLFIQSRVIGGVLRNSSQIAVPPFVRLFQWFPVLRRLPAWLVGVGFRAEHVGRQIRDSRPAC
jgi:2-polyprenyl-6-methoxyphenol hydroxylase-like FAD-dependent oxidoreductase